MRPKTQAQYLAQIKEWMSVRRSRRNVELNEETYQRALYVFLIEGVPELFTSEMTGMDFVREAMKVMSDAPASYFSHGLKSYIIPFAWWLGIVNGETMMMWKQMVPKYRSVINVADRTPSTADVVAFFSHLRTHHDANDFASCLYGAIAATLLVTGCRRRQITMLKVGEDVRVHVNEAGDKVEFAFIPYKDYSRNRHAITVDVSTPMPGGGTYGDYLYDWIDARPRKGERFFCLQDGSPVTAQRIYNFIRSTFHTATGTAYPPHALRAFTVSLIANTQSVEQAQHFVGHRHLTTTMRYHNPYANGNRTSSIIAGALMQIGGQ